MLAGVSRCPGELLGESLVVGACGVEVGFGSLGPDAQGGAGLFERGEPGVGGGVQLVALALAVGADAADFLGGLSLGSVGPVDSGTFGLLGACGLLLGPAVARRTGAEIFDGKPTRTLRAGGALGRAAS
jgi:hypothetical protein